MNVTATAKEQRDVPLLMACVGAFVAHPPVAAVSVSLPAIQRALHASASQLSWVSDAFVLPMATTPVRFGGRPLRGDRDSTRKRVARREH